MGISDNYEEKNNGNRMDWIGILGESQRHLRRSRIGRRIDWIGNLVESQRHLRRRRVGSRRD